MFKILFEIDLKCIYKYYQRNVSPFWHVWRKMNCSFRLEIVRFTLTNLCLPRHFGGSKTQIKLTTLVGVSRSVSRSEFEKPWYINKNKETKLFAIEEKLVLVSLNQGHVHGKWKIRRLVSTLHQTFKRMYRLFVLQTIIDFSFCTLQILHFHRKV